ncbi:hypothetical protein GCM10028783_32610 [Modestobacter muralis]
MPGPEAPESQEPAGSEGPAGADGAGAGGFTGDGAGATGFGATGLAAVGLDADDVDVEGLAVAAVDDFAVEGAVVAVDRASCTVAPSGTATDALGRSAGPDVAAADPRPARDAAVDPAASPAAGDGAAPVGSAKLVCVPSVWLPAPASWPSRPLHAVAMTITDVDTVRMTRPFRLKDKPHNRGGSAAAHPIRQQRNGTLTWTHSNVQITLGPQPPHESHRCHSPACSAVRRGLTAR